MLAYSAMGERNEMQRKCNEDIPLEKRRQGRPGLGTLSWIFLLKC
jgi:hypothetical protein